MRINTAPMDKKQSDQGFTDKRTSTEQYPIDWFTIGFMEGVQQKIQAVKSGHRNHRPNESAHLH